MHTFFGFVVRVLAVVAGLVFAAALALAFVLVVALWGLRTVWARLTGRPASPFVVRFRAAEGFRRAYRAAPQPARKPVVADVTDVEAKRFMPR